MTQSLEDYLKTISILSDETGGPVRVTDIAARREVSKPSAFTALKVLEERGLVEHGRYRTVTLTKAGNKEAALIRERYALLVVFLRQIVGVSIEQAGKDACLLEHHLSQETISKMKTLVQTSYETDRKNRDGKVHCFSRIIGSNIL